MLLFLYTCVRAWILMGNKIGRRKQVVDEKYTRPQGLYQHLDIDHKKLRKLILDAKLAPCYPGDDVVCTVDLEECPICFLYYPSLNRSKCCTKGLCTECFLQMKPTYPSSSVQCPFCKTSNYAVEYRGAKTKEEKSVEQFEEQRVIEAQIRIQQQELQDEKDRMQPKEDRSYSSTTSCFSCSSQDDEAISSEGSCNASICAGPSYSRQNRDGNSDLELEDLMVMEALWKSIQDQEIHRFPSDDIICSLPEFNRNSSVQTNADCQYFDICSTIVPGIGEPVSVNFSSKERSVAGHFPASSCIEDLSKSRTIVAHDNDSVEAETETSNNILSVSIDAESLEGEAIHFHCASPGVTAVL